MPALNLKTTPDGALRVDANYQTSEPGLYAVGDLTPGPMLAHRASEEALVAVETMQGVSTEPLAMQALPMVVYTAPEVASVGASETRLQEQGVIFNSGQFPFIANGRARASGAFDGLVKVLADAADGRILGVHMVGEQVSELAAMAATAIREGWDSHRLAETIFPHPTRSEALKEALLAVTGDAVHM